MIYLQQDLLIVIFDESIFPTLGGEKKQLEKEITWNASSLSNFDPRTNQCELEVKKIMHL